MSCRMGRICQFDVRTVGTVGGHTGVVDLIPNKTEKAVYQGEGNTTAQHLII